MVGDAHNLAEAEEQTTTGTKRTYSLKMPPVPITRLPPHGVCEARVLRCKQTITELMKEAEGFRRVAVEFGRELMNTEEDESDGRGLIVDSNPYAEDDATWIRYPESMETPYTAPFDDLPWSEARLLAFTTRKYNHHVRRFVNNGTMDSADRDQCRIPEGLVQKARMRYTYVRGQMHKKVHFANKHRMLLMYIRIRDGGSLPDELQEPFDKHLPDSSAGGAPLESACARECYKKWFEEVAEEYGHLKETYTVPAVGVARVLNPHPAGSSLP